MKVLKYPLTYSEMHSRFTATMPERAMILTVSAQGNTFYIWAAVTEKSGLEKERIFHVIESEGEELNIESWAYVGSYEPPWSFMSHVFEEFNWGKDGEKQI